MGETASAGERHTSAPPSTPKGTELLKNIMERIAAKRTADRTAIAGLVFVSDGTRGSEKMAATLRQRDAYATALANIAALPHEDYCCTKGCPGYGLACCRPLARGEHCTGTECTCFLATPLRLIEQAFGQ